MPLLGSLSTEGARFRDLYGRLHLPDGDLLSVKPSWPVNGGFVSVHSSQVRISTSKCGPSNPREDRQIVR